MAVYKFRVTFEDYDDVSRDIEIKPTQTFAELHDSIQKAINFDGTDAGIFYSSDDYWRKGDQIGKGDLSKSRLHDFIEYPHQKFLYEFGENGKWSFAVELLKIQPDENGQTYPKCVKSTGKAPAQYIKADIHNISEEDAKSAPSLADDLIDDTAFYAAGEEVDADIFAGDDDSEEALVEDGEIQEEESNEEADEFGAEFSDNQHPEEDY